MKNLFSILSSGVVIAFAMQSCNQPQVDTAREMAMVDSAANVRVMAYSDSLKTICMNNIMVLAQAKADSMMTAAMKKTPPGSKPKPKPVAAKPEPTTPTITNRPGATDAGSGTITNRPGTTMPSDTAKKPTITNRPGATQPATTTPPKL